MIWIQTKYPNLHKGQQAVHSVEVGAMAPEFEKSVTEPKPNLLATFNVKASNTINQLPYIIVSTAKMNISYKYSNCRRVTIQENLTLVPGYG